MCHYKSVSLGSLNVLEISDGYCSGDLIIKL